MLPHSIGSLRHTAYTGRILPMLRTGKTWTKQIEQITHTVRRQRASEMQRGDERDREMAGKSERGRQKRENENKQEKWKYPLQCKSCVHIFECMQCTHTVRKS